MKSLQESVGQPLTWTQPDAAHYKFELHAADALVATLQWQKFGGSLALAETAEGQWTFKRTGFFQPSATIRENKSEENFAVYQMYVGKGGTLQIVGDNTLFSWGCVGMWCTEYEWRDAEKHELLRFKPTGLLKIGAHVEGAPESFQKPMVPLLSVFGFYLIIAALQDSATNMVPIIVG